jgi:S1-C subfamily serine protease
MAVGKKEVTAEKEDDLNAFSLSISETPVGEPIELKIRRGKEEKKLVLNVGSQPKVKPEEFETGLGFTVKEITEGLYRQYALPDKLGVLVSFVEVGGAAFQGKLSEGDVIVKVEDTEVADLPSFKTAIDKHAKKSQLLLRVVRGKDKVFVLIPGAKQKAEK